MSTHDNNQGGAKATGYTSRGEQCPICPRLQEKAFEKKKKSWGGFPGPLPAVKHSFIKF